MRSIGRIANVAAAVAIGFCAPAAFGKTVITVTATQIFGTVDPAKIKDYTEYMAAVNLYEGLTTVDPKGNVLPLLAEKWEISKDSKLYRFNLVKNATFSNGNPVRAKDVVYSLQRIIAINKGPAFLFSNLISPQNIKAVDDYTVEIGLDRVFAPFLSTTPLIMVVDSTELEANAKPNDKWAEDYLASHAAGSGPFSLVSYDRGGQLVIKRNEKFHLGFPQHPIDEVRFLPTKDEATVKALAQRGEVHLTSRYQANETFDALAKMPNYRIVKNSTAAGFYFKLNHKVAPTDDVHVRRAIAYAVDYKTIRDVLYPGTELRGPMPPVFGDALATDLPAPEFNLEKAKAELQQSKYAGKGKVPLVQAYVQTAQFEEEIGLALKAALDQVGFDVKLQPEPWNRVTELASKADTTPAMSQIFNTPNYPSPDSVFYVQYHSKGAGTYSSMSWLQSPEIDGLIDQARQEVDPAKANEIYRNLQRKLVADQSDVYVLAAIERHGMHKCLDGYTWLPIISFGYNFGKFSWTCN
jgi:peptide/nickel transport system substrate-binding protein